MRICILHRSWRSPFAVGNKASGFTLLELLVVLVIIAVLIAIAIPAMQHLRELSRRSNCQQNLIQVSLAIANYESHHTHFPIGTLAEQGPVRSVPEGYHHNWISGILPKMGAMELYQAIDRSVSVYHPNNAAVAQTRVPVLLCPSASEVPENTTCYAGIHASLETPIDEDNDGVFRLNDPVSIDDITDGLSHTLFVGEKLSRYEQDLGWISGTRSSLRNTGHPLNQPLVPGEAKADAEVDVSPLYVGGLASQHPGGLHLLMGGGEVVFRDNSMDHELLQETANIADAAGEAAMDVAPIELEPSS